MKIKFNLRIIEPYEFRQWWQDDRVELLHALQAFFADRDADDALILGRIAGNSGADGLDDALLPATNSGDLTSFSPPIAFGAGYWSAPSTTIGTCGVAIVRAEVSRLSDSYSDSAFSLVHLASALLRHPDRSWDGDGSLRQNLVTKLSAIRSDLKVNHPHMSHLIERIALALDEA